jgi:hypothetical protein
MTIIILVSAAAGGAAVWFGKDWMMKLYMGAKTFADALEAKAKSIKDKL